METLHFVFRDEDGRGWYTFNDSFDVYMKRKVEIDAKLIELSAQLSKREVTDIIAAMKKAFNGGVKPDLAMIGFLIIEIEKRSEMLVHEEIMYDLLALHYIREDEDPAKVDPEVHTQKVGYLRESGNMAFFFDNRTLMELLPWVSGLEKHLQELLKDTRVEVQGLRLMLEAYTSEAGSATPVKT
jgi:hypothetical protein